MRAGLVENLLSGSTQNQLREALAETARARAAPAKPKKLAGIRVSAGGYLASAALLTFASLILLRTHRDLTALLLISSTWTIVPLLLLTDRLSFDGHTLSRSGLAALVSRLLRGRVPRINVKNVERVDVATL